MEPEELFKDVAYFCFANSNEQQLLWEKYHNQYNWTHPDNSYVIIVGCIDGDTIKGVNVCFSVNVIEGKKICFYTNISRYSDWRMIEQYVWKYAPRHKTGHVCVTDGTNFHNVLKILK